MRAKAALALMLLAGCASLAGAERSYEVAGTVEPAAQASVSLHGATSPFSTAVLSDGGGRFRFSKLAAGQYTLAAFVPGYGEKRMTIDVGPSSVDERGRFVVRVRFDADVARETLGGKVSARELAISERARKQYAEAQKRLARRDVDGAVERLDRAVEIEPRFVAAWNNLGTIAYQTRRYPDAEKFFRKALTVDPGAFEPLVNLGGVLLTLGKNDEAYSYNLYSVLKRPQDALANSQLGMNYFALGKAELAEKYLLEARRLDPGHFSHPQLLLTEIYLRRHDSAKAVEQLEEFLRYHPDWPRAGRIREAIARLKGE
ncbi:MAG: tetratricopeptide repeat protein [Acidobacteria bacterium]|nr:tetratricopeptide repeat protein [Acidobacteriota bacterium]